MKSKRGIYLYLDIELIDQLQKKHINISREVNEYLQRLIDKPEKPHDEFEADFQRVKEESDNAYRVWAAARDAMMIAQEKTFLQDYKKLWKLRQEAIDADNMDQLKLFGKDLVLFHKQLRKKGIDIRAIQHEAKMEYITESIEKKKIADSQSQTVSDKEEKQ